MTFYKEYGKRLFDLGLTIPALLLLAPLIGVLALLVRVKLGTPALFRQARPGLHGKPFELIKFRTMTDARDAAGQLLPDAERLTGFGRFLRSSSMDELPELWNVLLDVFYVERCAFLGDVKILWMTVTNVLRRQGIAADSHVTMPKFTGDL